MQNKVSMVIPCYNKAQYIATMFDSIIAQDWDIIELILINDGSTDNTRDIISKYDSKFRERGFEVVIIDQENAGVCAATKAGLERITGDYVCCVDADDELDHAYVSTMANWLDSHADCDICKCSFYLYETVEGHNKQIMNLDGEIEKPKEYLSNNDMVANELDAWLLCMTTWAPWVYMVRKSYFDKCNIVKNYYIQTRGSHEPFYAIPLLAYSGKMKRFDNLLYHFNSTEDETRHSMNLGIERAKKHWSEYWRNARIAIKSLDSNVFELKIKKRMLALLTLGMHRNTFLDFRVDASNFISEQRLDALKVIDRHFTLCQMPYGLCEFIDFWQANELFLRYCYIDSVIVHEMIIRFLALRELPPPIDRFRRVIGYGARGEIAKKLLPILEWSLLQPTELWDALDNNCDFKRLNEKDCVIVFPVKQKVRQEIKPILDSAGCYVLYLWDIPKQYIAECVRQSILGDFDLYK